MVLQFNKIITFYKPSKILETIGGSSASAGIFFFFFLGRINISELENNFHIFSLLRVFGDFLLGHSSSWQKEMYFYICLMRYFQRLWYQKVVLFAEIKRNKADSLTPITQFHTPMVLTAFINLSLLKLTYPGQISEMLNRVVEGSVCFAECMPWTKPIVTYTWKSEICTVKERVVVLRSVSC